MEGIEERGSCWRGKQLPIKLPLFEYDFYLCICCEKTENYLVDVCQFAMSIKLLGVKSC